MPDVCHDHEQVGKDRAAVDIMQDVLLFCGDQERQRTNISKSPGGAMGRGEQHKNEGLAGGWFQQSTTGLTHEPDDLFRLFVERMLFRFQCWQHRSTRPLIHHH